MTDAMSTRNGATCGPWIEVFNSGIDDSGILPDCDTGLAECPLTTGVRPNVLLNSGNTVAGRTSMRSGSINARTG